MRIAVIDADLIGRKRHNFPNLTCMKISGYYKGNGNEVILKMDYEDLDKFDKVFISKVFTDTPYPSEVLEMTNVSWGGTGFFFDKAPNLPDEIEHHMPDYHLYDEFVASQKAKGIKVSDEYTDYSIGYLTRGCFRKCGFCVNKKYDRVVEHSPLEEFYDPSRKKICLLDDNFLGCPNWKPLLQKLMDTGRRFTFKQGLDERLLTDEKCEMLFNAKYDKCMIFAFDKLSDYEIIESKLKLMRKHSNKEIMFYVLCGYDDNGIYDNDFWAKDIESIFIRISLLARYNALPYVMRYNRYNESPVRGMYINIARWANQPSLFKRQSLQEFIDINGEKSSSYRYLTEFKEKYKEFDSNWLKWKWLDYRR